jgi:hypothetical protein
MVSKGLTTSDAVLVAAAVVAIASGVAGGSRALRTVYRRTIGSRRDLARRLNQLAPGVTTRYVEERFGAPAFTRAFVLPAAVANEFASYPVRELVYRERHAWLQTLVDDQDAVIRFSITVTDPRFRFQIRDLTFGHISAKLGRSHFADLPASDIHWGRALRIGAHNHEYAEADYFGNPANYEYFVLSKNDAGIGDFGYQAVMQPGITPSNGGAVQMGIPWAQDGVLELDSTHPEGLAQFDPEAPYASRFRAGTTINTITILGPARPTVLLAEPRGPDSLIVRVLVPTPRERRQLRRQIRRANRQVAREIALNTSGTAMDDVVTEEPLSSPPEA